MENSREQLTPSFYMYVIYKLLHENGKVTEEPLKSWQKNKLIATT